MPDYLSPAQWLLYAIVVVTYRTLCLALSINFASSLFFCVFVCYVVPAEGEVAGVLAAESRMQGTIRRVATAAALANAEGGLGSWAMSRQGFLGEVLRRSSRLDFLWVVEP